MAVNDLISRTTFDIEAATKLINERTAGAGGTEKFPNTLLYTNSFFINSDAGFADYLSSSGAPDAISWDSYPFSNPAGFYITPTNWLSLGQHFRRHGLGSYISATGAA